MKPRVSYYWWRVSVEHLLNRRNMTKLKVQELYRTDAICQAIWYGLAAICSNYTKMNIDRWRVRHRCGVQSAWADSLHEHDGDYTTVRRRRIGTLETWRTKRMRTTYKTKMNTNDMRWWNSNSHKTVVVIVSVRSYYNPPGFHTAISYFFNAVHSTMWQHWHEYLEIGIFLYHRQ